MPELLITLAKVDSLFKFVAVLFPADLSCFGLCFHAFICYLTELFGGKCFLEAWIDPLEAVSFPPYS